MAIRRTQQPLKIVLEKDRKSRLDTLVDSWAMDERKFILQALGSYMPSMIQPTKNSMQDIKEFFFGK